MSENPVSHLIIFSHPFPDDSRKNGASTGEVGSTVGARIEESRGRGRSLRDGGGKDDVHERLLRGPRTIGRRLLRVRRGGEDGVFEQAGGLRCCKY